jgi:hypothetical protein
LINKTFRCYFTREYRQYVLKKSNGDPNESVNVICKRIERATEKLRCAQSDCSHMSQVSTKGDETDDQEDDIRFSDKVLGDVKRLIAIMLFTVFRFYQLQPTPSGDSLQSKILSEITNYIYEELKEKLIACVTKIVLSKNVYKISLAVCRHETMQQEMSLR